MKIILASKSPRRKVILQHYGYDVEVDVSNVNEDKTKHNDVKKLVMDLAKQKAEAVLPKHKNSIVVAADTMVYFKGQQIGKQRTPEDAEKTMKSMLGKTHEVYSGVCVINPKTGNTIVDYDLSRVTLNKVSNDVLKKYIESGNYKGKAGAYNISDPEFESFVGGVDGCKFNILGLPIDKVQLMIMEAKLGIE
jgi:septum formation protein